MTKKNNAEKVTAKQFGLTNNNPGPGTEVKKEPETKRLWFFATDNNRLRYGDNREIVLDETHTSDETPDLCVAGLHASPRIVDALIFAPGKNLCRVTLSGIVNTDNNFDWFTPNKYCGNSRTYHAVIDASTVLDEHVRDNLSKYLVKSPIKVNDDIAHFLETGIDPAYTINHLTAVDLKNQEERNFIDYVWRTCQAKLTDNGYAKMTLYCKLIYEMYYLPGLNEESLFKNLDAKALKTMNLTE
jgi:hypothetical protein